MIRKIFFSLSLVLGLFISNNLFAQDDSTTTKPPKERKPFKDRIYFGGNLGLQFGNQTYIDISPLIGYKVTEKFSAGFGVTYIYYKQHFPHSIPIFSTSSALIRKPAVSVMWTGTPSIWMVCSTLSRVVPATGVTMASSAPARALSKDDLPTLGCPAMTTRIPSRSSAP